MRRGRPPYPDTLTPREQEVLNLIRRGLTNRQIADQLGISLDGAKYHVSQILSKLYLESREEAARWRPNKPALGLGLIGVAVRNATQAGLLKTTTAVVVAAGVGVVALIALGVAIMQWRSESDNAADQGRLVSADASPFLALLQQFPATGDYQVVRYLDFARARQALGVNAPSQDAPGTDILNYPAALSTEAYMSLQRTSLLQAWGFARPERNWNAELGFNLANVDQSLEVVSEAANAPPGVALHGRFDSKRVGEALRRTSSFRNELEEPSHAGVSYFSWREEGQTVTGVPGGGPWPNRAAGRLVFEEDRVFWAHWTEQLEAMVDAGLGRRPSLADGEDYQFFAGLFEDLGIYAIEIYVERDWSWFERLWTLAENEYSRGRAPIDQQVYLKPYEGFAIGVGYDGSEPYAVIVLLHSDQEVAAANVPLLQVKVTSELRLREARPWSDAISRSDVQQSGRAVYAKLWMTNPGTIFEAWDNLESLFTSRR